MQSRWRRLAPLALAITILVGCGGTKSMVSYNAGANQTRFDTGTMTVAQATSGAGYGSQTSVVMQVTAQCSGADCTPKRAALSFFVQGSSDLSLSNRSISIEADGTTFAGGKRASWNRVTDSRQAEGRIAKITLPLADLDTIANAGTVKGSLGGMALRLARVQDQLRQFVETARNPAPHIENAPASQS